MISRNPPTSKLSLTQATTIPSHAYPIAVQIQITAIHRVTTTNITSTTTTTSSTAQNSKPSSTYSTISPCHISPRAPIPSYYPPKPQPHPFHPHPSSPTANPHPQAPPQHHLPASPHNFISQAPKPRLPPFPSTIPSFQPLPRSLISTSQKRRPAAIAPAAPYQPFICPAMDLPMTRQVAGRR